MKTVLGCIRRVDQDFGLIHEGDHVAVGVSGGKDSILLLYALSLYQRFVHTRFSLTAITLKMGLEPFDTAPIAALCEKLEIPYLTKETHIAEIIFEKRKEKHPCALCAKMRRGALNELAASHGCNRVALGHHREDVLETMLMSLLFEGRIHTFHPNTYLSRSGVTVIRPLVYLPEKHIIHVRKKLDLPLVSNPCPANGHTKRQEMKELLAQAAKQYPLIQERMLSALRNPEQYHLWDKKVDGKVPPPVGEAPQQEGILEG